MEQSGIWVESAARSFGEVHAVRDASFSVSPGQVVGLIGPNGAGKSTMLLMLATLLAPDHGRMSVAGFDPVTHPREARAKLGWMPDVLGSWATLTPRQALVTSARMYGIPHAQAAARAEELLHTVDLLPLANSASRVLSRGQKQRLSLARALVHDPEVLLLDEPASGLDPGARIALRDLVRRLASAGKSILISSHVLSELEEMADSAVYMTHGVTASPEAVAAAVHSQRGFRIKSLDAAALLRALDELGREVVELNGAQGPVVNLESEQAAAALLAELINRDVPIVSFTPAVGTFEHAFQDLSRGEGGQQ